ncbi:MAG: filamentous hemagglutinin N-terminal domain-containing protein [Gammaproteobacteria bacterium]|nr:filamentous hemagglutinin N-terminal domain-containing protein [Gammaproteobacteria bacterium]
MSDGIKGQLSRVGTADQGRAQTPFMVGGAHPTGRFRTAVLALALAAGAALAAPEGGRITAGSGSIQQVSPNTTQINQTSNSLSIDWQSFDVAPQETVRFVQPGRDAAVLNRIFDQKPSEIFGRIEANGRVFLMNPNGLVFGAGSVINVGALVATSLSLDANELNAADYRLFSVTGENTGAVINRGVITAASGGSVSLIGSVVKNEGQILADYGQINLASGSQAYLSFDGASLMHFSVSGEVTDNPGQAAAAVENSGSLVADGGRVLLSASAASQVFSEVVNNSGLVRASRIENVGGVVTLVGNGGNVVNRGVLDARGVGGQGGTIIISGERVGVFDTARIDASGNSGGGRIRIGGQAGEDGTVASTFTQIGAQTVIRADAGLSGDGGDIRVWAEDTSWAHGTITARGGSVAGDGGFVEISARRGISFAGSVDVSAANGEIGTLLFDPTDIIIHDQADGPQANDGVLPDLSDATAGAGLFNIGELALEGLASNANIILEASNDVILNDLADNRLALATDSTASLVILADSDSDGSGGFIMNSGDTIATNSGAIDITAASINAGGLDSNAAGSDGAITLSATGSIAVGTLDAGTQSVSIRVDSDDNGAETLTLGGTLAGSGGMTLLGGVNGGDTLIGPNGNNSWSITALNTGTLNGADFSDFTGLQGGSGDDTFTVTGIGSISGLINGGTHVAGDRVDYSGSTGLVSVTLGSSVINIETLVGGGADNTLIGENIANTWILTGQNDGNVAGVSFIDFANLTGGSGNDSFVLDNGSLTGTLSGGGGTDSLTANNSSNTWSIQSADGGNVDGVFTFTGIDNLIGGNGADIFLLNGGSVSGQIDGGAGSDALSANNTANTWNISVLNSGDVGGVNGFVGIENLNGNLDIDDFLFTSSGRISGTVDGGGGSDSVDLSVLSDPVVADLSGNGYANIELFIGNNGDSTLIGANAANSWIIDGSNDGTLNAISFVDFTRLTGGTDVDTFVFSNGGSLAGGIDGGTGDDTLTGDNAANSWDISALDAGQLNGSGYSNIENLVGNADVDTFVFADGSGVSGTVDGKAGIDSVDFSAETGTVDVRLGFAGFSNIETFTGNGSDSRITGEPALNDWQITGIDSGTLTTATATTAFSGFNHLLGNSGDDTFALSGGSISGSISGGGGNDILIGDAINNSWNISGADSGSVSGVAAFSAIANLTGNSSDDSFIFSDGSSISGVINGAFGSDSVDQSAQSGAVSISLASSSYSGIESFAGNGANSTLIGDDVDTNWRVTSTNSGTVGVINFVNFANLSGGSGADSFALAGGNISGTITGGGGTDELAGDNTTNGWNITGSDIGRLNGQNSFVEIERLFGGTLADTFIYDNGSRFSGGVDGGGGSDEVDMSAQTGSVSIVLGSSTFGNIESYVGNNIDSTLTGDFASNTWILTGTNSGNINSLAFVGFNNLIGNIQTDNFVISGGGITGRIDGGDGNDSLTASAANNTWNITTVDGGEVTNVNTFASIENLIGNSGTDIFVFGNTSNISGTVDGAAGTDTVDFSAEASSVSVLLGVSGYLNIESFIGNDIDSTLTAPAVSNTWQITGINDGTVAGVSFSNFNNLNGNVTTDTFIFNDGGQITGSVDGGTGLDTVDFSAESGVVSVQLGGSGYSNIETFIGNDSASTLMGDAISNNWLISGVNDGSLGNINFYDFNNILGNSAVDTFTLNGGSISGSLDGGAGADTLIADNRANSWNIVAIDTGSVTGVTGFNAIENLQGNIDTDNFVFADGATMSGVVDGAAGSDSVDHSAQTGAVSIALGGSAYLNIENFVGNDIDSSLVGANSANSWIVTGTNSGSVGTATFSGFTRLLGNAQDDTFAINSGSISGGIDGGAGNDSLNTQTGTNTWNITGIDVGNLNSTGGFSDIESLVGNNNVDRFVFANGASYSGRIDGAGGTDIVDHSSQAGAVQILLGSSAYTRVETFIGNNIDSTLVGDNSSNNWIITAQNAGDVNGIGFQDFNNLNGNSSVDVFTLSGGAITGQISGGGGNDTLVADDVANAWSVSGADSGTVTGVNGFVDIDNLSGGVQDDTFSLTSRLSGNLSAGDGDDVITLSGGASVGGLISGNAGTDTLRGPDINNNWAITGSDAGTLNTSSFQEIENLTGGTGNDSFSVSNAAAAALSGRIDAGGGDDMLSIDYSAASSRSLDFDGSAGNDRVIVSGGGSGFVNVLTLGTGSPQATLVSSGAGLAQILAVRNIETLQDGMTADTATINGSSANDALQLDSGTLVGSSPVRVTISSSLIYDLANKTDLAIDGGAGADTLTLGSDVSLVGDLSIAMEGVQNSAGATLSSNRLSLDQVSSGGASVAPIRTDVAIIDITGSSGDIYLLEANDVLLSASNVMGTLVVESLGGDIGSNGSLTVSGNAQFTVADTGSIRLMDAANDFMATLDFRSTGTLANLSFTNTRGIDIQSLVLSGDLSLTGNGAITQAGSLNVAGNSRIDAGSGGITLTDNANVFIGSVSLNNTGNRAVSFYNSVALILAASNLGSGSLSLSADGVTQSGPLVQAANAAAVNIDAGNSAITLDNGGNDFTGTVSLNTTGGSNIVLTDANQLNLGTSATRGGDITFTAIAGDIDLGRLNANDGGTITLTAMDGAINGNNSRITDPNLSAQHLVLSSGTIMGNFNNPIAVNVASGGTSLFVVGEGSANIIGLAGTILSGSSNVNNISATIAAVGQSQMTAIDKLPLFYLRDDDRYRLFGILEGGVRMPE